MPLPRRVGGYADLGNLHNFIGLAECAVWHAARIVYREGPTFMGSMMSRMFAVSRTLVAALALIVACGSAEAASRIKDLANVEGVRQNQLIG